MSDFQSNKILIPLVENTATPLPSATSNPFYVQVVVSNAAKLVFCIQA